jgi:hypothetical protein
LTCPFNQKNIPKCGRFSNEKHSSEVNNLCILKSNVWSILWPFLWNIINIRKFQSQRLNLWKMVDLMQKITLQIIVDTSARNNQPGSIESGFEKYLFCLSLYKLFWATVNTRTQLGLFCLWLINQRGCFDNEKQSNKFKSLHFSKISVLVFTSLFFYDFNQKYEHFSITKH